MSIVDLPGFVTDLKYHAAEGGFHYHEDHHCIDITTGRQWWEIQMHPDYDCDGPLELHIVADLDPRVQIAFEDEVNKLPDDAEWPQGGVRPRHPLPLAAPSPPQQSQPAGVGHRSRRHRGDRSPAARLGGRHHRHGHRRRGPDGARGIRVRIPLAQLMGEHEFLDGTFGLIGTVTQYLHDRAPAWLND